MSIISRLTSKWLHSNPQVRAQAVKELDESNVEILTSIANNDSETKIRRIAIKKIKSPRTLLEIARNDTDTAVCQFALQRAEYLLVKIAVDNRDLEESKRALTLLKKPQHLVSIINGASFKGIRTAALERITDDYSRAELVRKCTDSKLRAQNLVLIKNQTVLQDIVVDRQVSDLAAIALERIEDIDILETIAGQQGLSKSLRRRAIQRIEIIADESHPRKAKQHEQSCLTLCEKAEAISTEPNTEELTDIENRWTELVSKGRPSVELVERFQQATIAAHKVLARLRARQKIEVEQKKKFEFHQEARSILCEKLEALRDEINLETLHSIKTEWQSLGTPSKAEAERFTNAYRDAISRQKTLQIERDNRQTIITLIEKVEAITHSNDLKSALNYWVSIQDRWAILRTLAPEELIQRIDLAGQRLKKRQLEQTQKKEKDAQKTLLKLQQLTSSLEDLALAEGLNLKVANKKLRMSTSFLKNMGPLPKDINRKKSRDNLLRAREGLLKRTLNIQDTEDWRRWANIDIQKKLIQRLEELQESTAIFKVQKQLWTINEEWKRASSVPREQADELWFQYKTVRDALRARCDAFFEEQNAIREENLKKKALLCDRVETLSSSENWKDTTESIKKIQVSWKEIGPVPKKQSDLIWQQFRKACNAFFIRRKEHFGSVRDEQNYNLKQKEALCTSAESIQDSMDWSKTEKTFKELQSEWKKIGSTPSKQSALVWKRFRISCDHFFDRYKRRGEIENEEHHVQLLSLLKSTESKTEEQHDSSEWNVANAQTIWSEWKQLTKPSNPVDSNLHERVERAINSLITSSPENFLKTDLDPKINLKRRIKICEQLEEIVTKIGERHRDSSVSVEDLASRLKHALATNTMTSGQKDTSSRTFDWKTAAKEIERLEISWYRTPPIPGNDGSQIETRFDEVRRNFHAMKPRLKSSEELNSKLA